jgi:hypothetical protein
MESFFLNFPAKVVQTERNTKEKALKTTAEAKFFNVQCSMFNDFSYLCAQI